MGKHNSGMRMGILTAGGDSPGINAADMIDNREFGKMVALKNDVIVSVVIADVSGKSKLAEPDNPLLLQAPNMVTNFGMLQKFNQALHCRANEKNNLYPSWQG
jgi:hypothetical protein